MTAVVLHGWAALAVILVFCVLACAPVYVASLLVRDWMRDRIEAAYRRRCTAEGMTPTEIDAGWRQVLARSEGKPWDSDDA